MHEQARLIEAELSALGNDIDRLDRRAVKLQEHFRQVDDDIRQIRISTEKISQRADRIDIAQLGETLAPPHTPDGVDDNDGAHAASNSRD